MPLILVLLCCSNRMSETKSFVRNKKNTCSVTLWEAGKPKMKAAASGASSSAASSPPWQKAEGQEREQTLCPHMTEEQRRTNPLLQAVYTAAANLLTEALPDISRRMHLPTVMHRESRFQRMNFRERSWTLSILRAQTFTLPVLSALLPFFVHLNQSLVIRCSSLCSKYHGDLTGHTFYCRVLD